MRRNCGKHWDWNFTFEVKDPTRRYHVRGVRRSSRNSGTPWKTSRLSPSPPSPRPPMGICHPFRCWPRRQLVGASGNRHGSPRGPRISFHSSSRGDFCGLDPHGVCFNQASGKSGAEGLLESGDAGIASLGALHDVRLFCVRDDQLLILHPPSTG
jgi:hypothetical protein